MNLHRVVANEHLLYSSSNFFFSFFYLLLLLLSSPSSSSTPLTPVHIFLSSIHVWFAFLMIPNGSQFHMMRQGWKFITNHLLCGSQLRANCELYIWEFNLFHVFFFFIRLRLILIVNICWMSTWTIWLSFVHLHHCCSALDWSTWLYRIPSYSSAHENFIYFSFFFGNKFVVLSLTHAHTHIMMNWINLFSNVAIYLNII